MPFPTVPNPYVWANGTPIAADVLRGQVSDTVALLSQPPAFNGIQTGLSQSIPNSNSTPVQLNTEIWDNYNGHVANTGAVNPYYFPKIPGYYLCQGAAPFALGSGGQRLSTLISGTQNGSGPTDFGGPIIIGAATHSPGGIAAKLVKIQQIGVDNIYMSAWQASGGAQPLANSSPSWPSLTCRWVCSLATGINLPVPANPPWPVPPAFITSAFMAANVTQTIEFLTCPPVCEALTASGSVASVAGIPTTGTTVVLSSSSVDTFNAYNNTSGVWTAPVSGQYFLYGSVPLAMGAGGQAVATGFTITSGNYNGGTTFTYWGGSGQATASSICGMAARRRLRLSAGDTVALAVAQSDSGSAAANYATGTWTPRFISVWEGA